MRIIIADDEPIARQVLREQLDEVGGVEIAGEAANGLEAAELIACTHPDVVFLDLQMPGLDGFAVARGLAGHTKPVVVFVTAYDEHALEAFNIGAADYLLKPVRRERLVAALQKVRPLVQARRPAAQEPKDPLRKVVGRAGGDFHLIDPADVVAFQADGETVWILSTSGRFRCGHTLKTLVARLPPGDFRRIHRQTIINTRHIRKISPLSSKRWLLRMSNGLELIVSKRLAGVIRDETRW